VFKATEDMTLKKIWKKYPNKQIRAASGEDSCKTRIVGRRGADAVIEVPPGITVIDVESNKAIAEINERDETVVVARGGKINFFKYFSVKI
jgi:GTPase involved in cell partitioning and DNA repair